MESKCKNHDKCPIFDGILIDKTMTAANYRRVYCEAGEKAWQSCKRYQVKEQTGMCPPDLLPNSTQSIYLIIQEMKMMMKLSK